jgi:hypothetical protein
MKVGDKWRQELCEEAERVLRAFAEVYLQKREPYDPCATCLFRDKKREECNCDFARDQ